MQATDDEREQGSLKKKKGGAPAEKGHSSYQMPALYLCNRTLAWQDQVGCCCEAFPRRGSLLPYRVAFHAGWLPLRSHMH